MSKLSEATQSGNITVRSDRPHEVEPATHCTDPCAATRTDSGAAGAVGIVESGAALAVLREQAIGFLRGEENPFDVFVAGESADNDLFRSHVPEVHAEVFAKVRAAIEKLSRPDYHHRAALHPTRALIVRGPRGAGKTHLLHAIQYRAGGEHDLLVRPRYFEPHPTFAEFLLKELLRSLLAREENEPPSPLGWVAGQIARTLLREALAGLGPGEWLEWTCRPGLLAVLVGRRWTWQSSAHSALLEQLAASTPTRPVHELCAAYGLTVAAARQIAARHIARCDVGDSSIVRMRRRLLSTLAELGMTGNRDPFVQFVEHEFAEAEQGLPPTRAELVDHLLRTLVELMAACQVPVLVAFDNVERLLAPRGRLAVELAQSFFSGLAQVIDTVPGMLVLLLVEGGLWTECQKLAIDSFAHDRLVQGIRLRNYGNVALLDLEPPTADALEHLVRRRTRPLLERVSGSDKLPELFPFDRADLQQVARFKNDVLRAALMRLRDRYDELVLPRAAPRRDEPEPVRAAEAPQPTLSQLQLERELLVPKWERAVTRARRELENSARGTLADKLHTGLGRWLDTFSGTELAGGCKLLRVEPAVTYGDHPTYGVVTVAHWRFGDETVRRVALGVVLGQGPAMPKDLAVKLSLFRQRPAPADELVVLWPERDADFGPSALAAASQQVWTQHAAGKPVRLFGLPATDLAWLWAFADWSSDVCETELSQGSGWPPDAVAKFLRDRTGGLIERLLPVRQE